MTTNSLSRQGLARIIRNSTMIMGKFSNRMTCSIAERSYPHIIADFNLTSIFSKGNNLSCGTYTTRNCA